MYVFVPMGPTIVPAYLFGSYCVSVLKDVLRPVYYWDTSVSDTYIFLSARI